MYEWYMTDVRKKMAYISRSKKRHFTVKEAALYAKNSGTSLVEKYRFIIWG